MEKPILKNGASTADAWRIEELHRHFPKHTHDEVLDALEDCQREPGCDHPAKLLRCLQARLTPQAADGID